MCVQRKAQKISVTEEDLVKSNIDSFGDDIGKTTNWITSMFDVQARFEPGSKEYDTLEYRIMCGQLFQQNKQLYADCSPVQQCAGKTTH